VQSYSKDVSYTQDDLDLLTYVASHVATLVARWQSNKALKEANEYWGARIPSSLTNTAVIADGDASFLAGRVLQDLKGHFPEAQQIKDFQTAVASGKKAVVLVDIKPEIGQRTPVTNKFDITYYFFDAKMNPVSKLTGHGEHYAAFASMTVGIQDCIEQALAQLDQKMKVAAR